MLPPGFQQVTTKVTFKTELSCLVTPNCLWLLSLVFLVVAQTGSQQLLVFSTIKTELKNLICPNLLTP